MINLFSKIRNYFKYIHYFIGISRVNISMSRCSIASSLRDIDHKTPSSWEFCGFSQNGEDGIIDVLLGKLKNPNKYFIEIGSSDGIENNTAFLAMVKRYSGLWVDSGGKEIERAKNIFGRFCILDYLNLKVEPDNCDVILRNARCANPDVFSLDIDSNDYHVAKSLMELGMRPKIVVVEYNSVFGPKRNVAACYRKDIYKEIGRGEIPSLYWGCSLEGWKKFWGSHGYKFITIESNGVNAFFVDPNEFDVKFLSGIKKDTRFIDNISIRNSHGRTWKEHYNIIKNMPLHDI